MATFVIKLEVTKWHLDFSFKDEMNPEGMRESYFEDEVDLHELTIEAETTALAIEKAQTLYSWNEPDFGQDALAIDWRCTS